MQIINSALILEDEDFSDLDKTLSVIIHDSIVEFKKRGRYGIPSSLAQDYNMLDPNSESLLSLKWDYILDEIIYGFSELDENDEMTYDRQVKGRILFAKYFNSLWE